MKNTSGLDRNMAVRQSKSKSEEVVIIDDEPVKKKKKGPKNEEEKPVKESKEADLFEDEDEDETPERSSVVQSGWAAAKARATASSTTYVNDFRASDEVQVVKFLDVEPFFFRQHWIERKGKRSFVCLEDTCPLCGVGDVPSDKYVFAVLNLSSEPPTPQLYTVSKSRFENLSQLHESTKTGPLPRLWWGISATGHGSSRVPNYVPIKDRDLEEDWDINLADAERLVASTQPISPSSIYVTPLAELRRLVDEELS